MRRRLFLFFLMLPGLIYAQQQMEIIPLRHRTVEQVVPVLQPLLESGGTLSGMTGQLIIRTSRRNLAELIQALEAIDQPARRLVIQVSQNREVQKQEHAVDVSGSVGFEHNGRIIEPSGRVPDSTRIEVRRGSSRVSAQILDRQRAGEMRASQSVQVIDGGQAFIQIGRSVPLSMRQVVLTPSGAVVSENIVYRDIGQGFYAVPRLSGELVTLEISPQFDSQSTQSYGRVTTQRLTTTVTGRLGEWVELGGSHQQASMHGQRHLSRESADLSENRSIWFRVDELP